MVSKMKPSLEMTEDIFLTLYLHKDLRNLKSLLSGLQLMLDLLPILLVLEPLRRSSWINLQTPTFLQPLLLKVSELVQSRSLVRKIFALFLTFFNVSVAGVGTFSAPIRMLNKDGTSGPHLEQKNLTLVLLVLQTVFLVVYSHCKRIMNCMLVKVFVLSLMMVHCLMVLILMTIYFAVTNDSQNETLNADQIKLARTENEDLFWVVLVTLSPLTTIRVVD